MSNLVFESQVNAMVRKGIPRDYAILSVSSKLEDKTIFYQTLQKLNEENKVIQEQMELSGFKLSTDIEEDITLPPTNDNQIQDIQYNQS